ncbi:MAG: AraC family transcriptional regulator [Mucilaginibacter sp.]|nr:AraC family transcriptional regulator [Mucilaginibacter sp.]
MHHQDIESPEKLQDAIQGFWYVRWDGEESQDGFEVMPDGHAEIIFHFGSGCSIARNGSLQPLPSPFMVGLLNEPVVFYPESRLEIIGIKCLPWAVFDLLDLPFGKERVHAFEHPIARLQSALNTFILDGKIDEALELVKQYFLNVRSGIAANTMLYKAGAALRKANGTLAVSEVAAAAHSTIRTLERNFKRSSGHTVKDVSGLMRFEHARNQLWRYPDANISGLAHELGCTDQSHLNREFKRYSGTTAAAFARKARTGKDAVSADFVAFVLS